MIKVILAYSRIHRQLPTNVRARWRQRMDPVQAVRLSRDARAQSQSLLGVALACAVLSEVCGRRVEPGELRYTASGKPHVVGLPKFSIAHAGEWVLCALSSCGAVGVDIEPLAPLATLPRWLAVFDQHERAAARSARAALAIWCTKEATLKAAGADFAELPQVRVRGRQVAFRGRRWHSRAPRIAPQLVARLVTERPVSALVMRSLRASAVLAA